MSRRCRFGDVIYPLLVAAAAGLVVAGTAYLCSYFDQRDLFSNRDQQLFTLQKLDGLEGAVKMHQRATGKLPMDLAELSAVKFYRHFGVNAEGRVVDVWDHPYHYRVEGDRFELSSLGADGLPGGVGRDADLFPSSAGWQPELPTLRQFTFDLPTKGVQRICVAAGVCAALICLVVTRRRRGAEHLPRAAATVLGAILIAIAITSLQVSSGR